MTAKTVDDKSHSLPHDPEKTGIHAAPRSGSIDNPEGLSYTIDTNRETDFRTRNGLNLRSFQRRKSITHLPAVPDSMLTTDQVLLAQVEFPNLTIP